jgi:hypothetical protein
MRFRPRRRDKGSSDVDDFRSNSMMRTVACALTALVLCAGFNVATAKAAKNQMVKGTIKTIDTAGGVLIVNQKVKDEVVVRELAIVEDTEIELTTSKGTETAVGKGGLKLLEGLEGASVKVKCDKDVKVLKVSVTGKK